MKNIECVVFGVEEVQKMLGLGRKAVYALFNREDFPSMLVGNKKMVTKDDFWTWVAQQKNQCKSGA